MFKSAISRPWICSRCIRQQIPPRIRRSHVQAVPSTPLDDPIALEAEASPRQVAIGPTTPGSQYDDKTLGQIFDSPGFWKEYSQSSKSGHHAGLFQNRYLTSPAGFEQFANTSLEKAKRVVAKILAASTTEQYEHVVKDLERLSDLLCRIIDLADFVRATHPDPRINQAATRAYAKMYEYMNVLNTTTGLARQLDVAIKTAGSAWEEEERLVAAILKRDFAKSAVDLPQGDKEKFVQLSQEISEVGSDFVESMESAQPFVQFKSSSLYGMDPILVKEFTRWGQVTLPAIGEASHAALHTVYDAQVRKQIFSAGRTASKSSLKRLHSLLSKRAELAKLSRFKSYAHMSLEDKMAKTPEAVNGFLQELSKDNRPRVQSCLTDLLAAKKSYTKNPDSVLEPWDKEFYMSQVLSSVPSRLRNADFLSSYFSLGRVMQGISRLFTRLYGIRFVPRENLPGETWNSDVRTLDIISQTDGHVAVMYCDLFARPGKSPNPAHFTIRCSRRIRDGEIQEAAAIANPLFESAEQAANDGMAFSRTPNGVMQLPIIALICNFATNPGSKTPSLLSFNEVSTLFHEMGHAIHSILGRTNFQEVSGTRCATDFAELPSIIMEHFAADPSVLALFARHYETDKPLPVEMIAEKLALDKKFESVDTEHQLILSLLDQACHSHLALNPSFNTTEVFHSLQRQHGVMPPDPAGTCGEGFFGHLFGYGGSYYSYLFDRVLAERIWQQVFSGGREGGGLARENGERFKDEVLKWGGARDPWKCLAGVLREERVESGGKEAMQLVGSWGVERRRRDRLEGRGSKL
ncbi:Mitochondrial intermediate peptidase [Cadophora gregata]|uniref:Mitochondrial intermediate peptidase n=1 Tax=Cadophora gregata TaxID=51156 RepID=UPI0026DD486D|nr:Mitochondrial intermediate peptidase [Cadophora gregata]KAK0102516.1 Mitochondrial intermediate peptidase [Cadophora gregata]KAK0104143.1 Mitochondrial intermediate peptidase [Cadophora gregata f. sp. sojae]